MRNTSARGWVAAVWRSVNSLLTASGAEIAGAVGIDSVIVTLSDGRMRLLSAVQNSDGLRKTLGLRGHQRQRVKLIHQKALKRVPGHHRIGRKHLQYLCEQPVFAQRVVIAGHVARPRDNQIGAGDTHRRERFEAADPRVVQPPLQAAPMRFRLFPIGGGDLLTGVNAARTTVDGPGACLRALGCWLGSVAACVVQMPGA